VLMARRPFRSVLAPALASPPRAIQSTVDPITERSSQEREPLLA
jgi:hypothetical protein